MSVVLHIYSEHDSAFVKEVAQALQEANIEFKKETVRTRGGEPFLDIILELSSAGFFTTVFATLVKFLMSPRNKYHKIVMEVNGKKVIIEGHTLPEEERVIKELDLKQIFPELLSSKQKNSKPEPDEADAGDG